MKLVPTGSSHTKRSVATKNGRLVRWLSRIVGFATLVTVVAIARHISEPREFARLVERAEPWWIAVALVLQAGTYVALAEIWRAAVRVARHFLPRAYAVQAALAKLFVDQALPTFGISGSMLVASALEQRGLERSVIIATVVIEFATYYFAYALSLVVAIAIAGAPGELGAIVMWSALGFSVFAIALAAGALSLARRRRPLPNLLGLRRAQQWLSSADMRIVGDVRLLARALAWQLAIVGLDGLTMWTLLRAVGTHVAIAGVYASFMISSLARTISIVPGGLGVFEGVAVITLHQLGAPVAAALSAALLFRGVSYWLPMIPGFIASRRLR